jgi:hypothetical protein
MTQRRRGRSNARFPTYVPNRSFTFTFDLLDLVARARRVRIFLTLTLPSGGARPGERRGFLFHECPEYQAFSREDFPECALGVVRAGEARRAARDLRHFSRVGLKVKIATRIATAHRTPRWEKTSSEEPLATPTRRRR